LNDNEHLHVIDVTFSDLTFASEWR